MKTFLILLAVILFYFHPSYSDSIKNEPVAPPLATVNKNSEIIEKWFYWHDMEISIDHKAVHFKSNSAKFIEGEITHDFKFVTDFTLSKTGDKFSWLDHHGSRVFTLKNIAADRIVLTYEEHWHAAESNSFSHDSGEITLHSFNKQKIIEKAQRYVKENKIDVSNKFIKSSQYIPSKELWIIQYNSKIGKEASSIKTVGGQTFVNIHKNGKIVVTYGE